MSPPTRFSESNALLAIQAGERIEARRILSGMLPHELRQLAEAARNLAWEADTEADNRRPNG